jgi:hypothetical protein
MRGVGRIHLHPVLFCGDPLPILCCSTTPITLFTLSYVPLTVWNSRLCVAKFLSGQYTLCPCCQLSLFVPSPPHGDCLLWGLSAGALPPCVIHCRGSLSHLGRVPPPDGSETSSSLWTNTDFLCVCYVVKTFLLGDHSTASSCSACLILSVLTFVSCFPDERVGRGVPSSNPD